MTDDLPAYAEQPNEWGRWGAEDEIGRANLLDAQRVLASAQSIVTGERFSLALPIGSPGGDPCLPGRGGARHTMTQSALDYVDGRAQPLAGGMQYADDRIDVACHGTTHMDALDHAFAADTSWNGRTADSDADGVHGADIAALSRKGIVGRAVLVDLARARGVDVVPMHTSITVADIQHALALQQVALKPGDTLLLRTGIFTMFYDDGPARFYDDFAEPGLVYEPRTVDFFREHDLAGLGSDTICNEEAHSSTTPAAFPLHVLLQRNLGVIFHEALWLEDLAAYCASEQRYSSFYIAAPLHIVGGSGAPMNPIAIM